MRRIVCDSFVIIVGILTYRVNNTYIKSSTQSNLIKNAKIMDKLELTRKIAEELNEEIGLTTRFSSLSRTKTKEITLTSSKFNWFTLLGVIAPSYGPTKEVN